MNSRGVNSFLTHFGGEKCSEKYQDHERKKGKFINCSKFLTLFLSHRRNSHLVDSHRLREDCQGAQVSVVIASRFFRSPFFTTSAAGIYKPSGSFRTGIKRRGSKLSPTGLLSPRSSTNPFLSAAAQRNPQAASSFKQRRTNHPVEEPAVQADQTAGPSSSSNPFLAAASVSSKLPYSAVVAGTHSKQQQNRPSRPPLQAAGPFSSNQQTSQRPGQPAISANPFIKALTKVHEQQQQVEATYQVGDEETMEEQEDTGWLTEGHTQGQNEPMFSFAPPQSDSSSLAGTTQASSNSSSGVGGRSLHLKGVPREMNNELSLREHFERFGAVESIKCHPEKIVCSS